MTSNRYVQSDNHREILFGIVHVSLSVDNPTEKQKHPFLVGVHGSARLVLIGEKPQSQKTLLSLEGKALHVSGIWKRAALHFR